MIGLSIESSCDETSVAILKDGKEVLSNIVSSQIQIHKAFGGVVPEIASRYHTKNISYIVKEAIEKACITFKDLDYIGVTYGPGLVGALLVGVSYAKCLAYRLNIPIVPVHHIKGHIAANYITHKDLKPPFIALVVSGGHSHIVHVKNYIDYTILGKTRDDAVGEAFDKVARTLKLGYPGGPEISDRAKLGKASYILPKTKFENYDFSFSGIKTNVLNLVNNSKGTINVNDMCKSFEQNVCEVLVDHTLKVMNDYSIHTVVLAGGVSANSYLRELLVSKCMKLNYKSYISYDKSKFDILNNLSLNAKASLSLEK
ncbi:MAG: tRNA (adenosine(37)-N6)-threonylcarbamoyltransferase complex transferase subunit TsaD [Clostridia bacterium]